MTDRELLEAAAKAAGYGIARWSDDQSGLLLIGVQDAWNPLTDDGDALRLAAKLSLRVYIVNGDRCEVDRGNDDSLLTWHAVNADIDIMSATRRAIVRAAAAMVK